jgi:DNA-binding transcriptional ArsR family regulator
MPTHTVPDLARVGAVIGQPARAAMLGVLLGGQWLTATELARAASVAPSTASEHLTAMVHAGLVRRRQTGRRRYHALAGPDVAAALEGLLRVANPSSDPGNRGPSDHALRFARTCYDHLAGELGVWLSEALVRRGLVSPDGMQVTAEGEAWFAALAIDVPALRRGRRPCVRFCLDWSERRDHLAGSVGAAIVDTLLERGWIVRMPGTRAVRLTLRGRIGLERAVGATGAVPVMPGQFR